MDMGIMANLQDIVNIVKNIISLKEVYLFGSYAYGKPSDESDFDLYFVVEEINKTYHEQTVEIYKAIYKKTKKPVDILLNTKEAFEYRASNKATLEYKIVKDGVKIYG